MNHFDYSIQMACCGSSPRGRRVKSAGASSPAAERLHGTGSGLGRTKTASPDPKRSSLRSLTPRSPQAIESDKTCQPIAVDAIESALAQHLSSCVNSLELGSQHGAREELADSLVAHGKQLTAMLVPEEGIPDPRPEPEPETTSVSPQAAAPDAA